ncbi:hypothetical protein ACVIKP_002096 [Rhizobium leguminosarum]
MPHVSTMKLPNTIIELNSLVAPRSDVVLMSKLIGQCSGLLLPTHELQACRHISREPTAVLAIQHNALRKDTRGGGRANRNVQSRDMQNCITQ